MENFMNPPLVSKSWLCSYCKKKIEPADMTIANAVRWHKDCHKTHIAYSLKNDALASIKRALVIMVKGAR